MRAVRLPGECASVRAYRLRRPICRALAYPLPLPSERQQASNFSFFCWSAWLPFVAAEEAERRLASNLSFHWVPFAVPFASLHSNIHPCITLLRSPPPYLSLSLSLTQSNRKWTSVGLPSFTPNLHN